MFDWDAGNISHISRHGISTDEAEQVVANDPVELGQQNRNGELRTLLIGESDAGRILVVVVTLRNTAVRIVTGWPAGKSERSDYALEKEKRREHTDG